jgi:hypothetical protein
MDKSNTTPAWTAEDREYFRKLFAAPVAHLCTWCGNDGAARAGGICTRRACIERH